MSASSQPSPTAWITGAGGLIGNYLFRAADAHAPGWQVVGLRRSDLELTDFAAVRARFYRDRPQLVIHCAALSKSTACEADPALARKLNVDVTSLLCELAADMPLVFFSSDLVFDGRRGNYVEDDEVNPLSVYGETKVAAEQIVLSNPLHVVIRTSLNAGISPTGDRGFNEQMRLAWRAGQTLRLFTDEFRCPIPAVLTARAVWELVEKNQIGLFHVAGSERLSRWQIGQLIAERWPDLNPKMEPVSIKNSPAGPRPADTSLDCAKAQKLLSFALPGLTDWLEAHPEEVF